VGVAEDATADPEDHGSVAAYQGFKRGLIPPLDEKCQQMSVGRLVGALRCQDAATELDNAHKRTGRHPQGPLTAGVRVALYILVFRVMD